jgi:hypothetical protein
MVGCDPPPVSKLRNPPVPQHRQVSSPNWPEARCSAAPLWVQRPEPDVVERAGHPAHVLLPAVQQVRDIRSALALRRHQHPRSPGAASPDPWPYARSGAVRAPRSSRPAGSSVRTTGASSHPTRPHLAFDIACKELADMRSTSLENPSTARRKDSAIRRIPGWLQESRDVPLTRAR